MVWRMTAELQTERLILRPLALTDAPQVQKIFPRWEIVKFLNSRIPWPFPADGVLTFYRDQALPAVERGEEWHWTLRAKESSEQVIGAISLHKDAPMNRGFWLTPEWQGRGLMTEAVVAVSDFWFEVLGFSVLRTRKAVGNVASQHISKKTGMRMVGTEESEYVSGRLLTEIWEITAEEWSQAKVQMQDQLKNSGG